MFQAGWMEFGPMGEAPATKAQRGRDFLIDTGTQNYDFVSLKEALATLREAKKEGRTAWLMIGGASTKKR
jgi:hypothetical protein